jgi:hypothetical protein
MHDGLTTAQLKGLLGSDGVHLKSNLGRYAREGLVYRQSVDPITWALDVGQREP